MPIYEYTCQDCQTSFEMIRRFEQADTDLKCVKCQGENIKRRISLFNASSSGHVISGNSGCSSCAGGSCNTCHPN